MKKPIKVGIDTGVKTGISVSLNGVLQKVESMTITQAMVYVLQYCPQQDTKLYIEDARLWNGRSRNLGITEAKLKAKAQGAGSVKRDAQIWEDWCNENGYEYLMIAPSAKGAKINDKDFKCITGWQGRTNEHARDSAMLIFGRP